MGLDLHLRSLFDPRPLIRLALYLRRERIDLVHTHLRYSNIVGRTAATLTAAGRAVSTIHNIVETDPGWRQAIRRWLDFATARRICGAVITVSAAQRQFYLGIARVEPARVETHRNGVDTRLFQPDPTARALLRTELGLDGETVLFMTIGALQPYKGIRHLLEAAALVRKPCRASASRSSALALSAPSWMCTRRGAWSG